MLTIVGWHQVVAAMPSILSSRQAVQKNRPELRDIFAPGDGQKAMDAAFAAAMSRANLSRGSGAFRGTRRYLRCWMPAPSPAALYAVD